MYILLRVLFVLMSLLLAARAVYGQPPRVAAGETLVTSGSATPFGPNAYRVPAYAVYDGDTLTQATVQLDFGAALTGQSIRFFDFDAWELTSARQTVQVTDAEKAKGRKARDELAALLKEGEVWIQPTGDGKSVYGRLEADVWLVRAKEKPLHVATWLRERGHERK